MTKRDLEAGKQKAKIIIRELKKLFPQSKLALNFSNPWELLVAVILSAQCTDKLVNKITLVLFRKYKKLDDYAMADIKEFEKDIGSVNFFRNKAKNILAAAKIIKEKHNGKVPDKMGELLELPGVARKTANIVLGSAYGVVEGIAVDTHVKRLSRLLGLTGETNPNKIEKDLMEIIPKREWLEFNYRLIDYGRKYCPARPHKHEECPLTKTISKLPASTRCFQRGGQVPNSPTEGGSVSGGQMRHRYKFGES